MTINRKHKHLHWAPRGISPLLEHEMPEHDPPLSPHDEAVFLLHVAAEIEHALLVQYLYAAYSLKPPAEVPAAHQAQVRTWRRTVLGIAREEMGHLITVENLLRLLGGPLTLEREDYPFLSGLYPFHFRLEPLSKNALAKYVVAEMPLLDTPTDEMQGCIGQATSAATMPVNRIGAIYTRLTELFQAPAVGGERHLTDADFVPTARDHQAHYADWGDGPAMLIPEIHDRATALAAIAALSEQGEGLEDSLDPPSHYQRFLAIYRAFPEPGDWAPAYPVPTDPNTSPIGPAGQDLALDHGRISDPQARLWAQLCNLRYRLLLNYLAHFLHLSGPLLDHAGHYTRRGYLRKWTFDEMRRLSLIAGKLATLPRMAGAPEQPDRAGAPFEMPYVMHLPDREPDRWWWHLDVVGAAIHLAHRLAADSAASDPLLAAIRADDTATLAILQARAAETPLPAPPAQFPQIVRILDDAVRGFPIGVHHNFWCGCTRDEFIALTIFDQPLIARTPDGGFDADGSALVRALRGLAPFDGASAPDAPHFPRMPAHRPPVPAVQIGVIRAWIAAGCPDGDPPGQIGLADTPG